MRRTTGQAYFCSRFQSKVSQPHCFEPEMRQNVMVAGACGRESCPPCGSQEAKDEEGAGKDLPSHLPVTSFYWLGSAQIPTVHSAAGLTDEFIRGLTYSRSNQGSTFGHCCLKDSVFNGQGSREHLYLTHFILHLPEGSPGTVSGEPSRRA